MWVHLGWQEAAKVSKFENFVPYHLHLQKGTIPLLPAKKDPSFTIAFKKASYDFYLHLNTIYDLVEGSEVWSHNRL